MDELTEGQAVAITTLQGMIKSLLNQGLRPHLIQSYINVIYAQSGPDGLMDTIETAQDFDYEEYEIPDDEQ